MSISDSLGVEVPRGLDPWLLDFLDQATKETDVLRRNGADGQAAARDSMLRDLLRMAADWLNTEIDVPEAAQILGRCEETVRRSIRDGELPDLRTGSRGRHKTRRGDVLAAAGGGRKYDPVADAQGIAKLRRLA